MSVHDGNYKAVKKALGIPDNEPVFVLRAKDVFAIPTIMRYANFAAAVAEQPGSEWFDNIHKTVDDFMQFKVENAKLIRVPD